MDACENDSDRKKDVYRDLMMSKVNDLKCRLMEYGVAKKGALWK